MPTYSGKKSAFFQGIQHVKSNQRGEDQSGERIDAPRCEGATVGVAGWVSRPHTVMVLDINKLLPADWPRLDGLISLSTFAGHVVTIDLPSQRLVVDDTVPRDARSVRTRFERSVTGLSLVAFVASRHDATDVWLEVDTGSEMDGASRPNRKVIPLANRFYYLSAAKMNSKPVKEAN